MPDLCLFRHLLNCTVETNFQKYISEQITTKNLTTQQQQVALVRLSISGCRGSLIKRAMTLKNTVLHCSIPFTNTMVRMHITDPKQKYTVSLTIPDLKQKLQHLFHKVLCCRWYRNIGTGLTILCHQNHYMKSAVVFTKAKSAYLQAHGYLWGCTKMSILKIEEWHKYAYIQYGAHICDARPS